MKLISTILTTSLILFYGNANSQNMRNFSNPHNIKGVARPQHGSFMRITDGEYDRLQKWSDERSNIQ